MLRWAADSSGGLGQVVGQLGGASAGVQQPGCACTALCDAGARSQAPWLAARRCRCTPTAQPSSSALPPFPAASRQVNYELTLPAVRESLTFGPGQQRHLPIVTGFLGRGLQTGAITTLGRGGSDLTCTLLGAALGLPEVQVRSLAARLGGPVIGCWSAGTLRAGLGAPGGPASAQLPAWAGSQKGAGAPGRYARCLTSRSDPARGRPCTPFTLSLPLSCHASGPALRRQVWKDVDGVLTADPRVVETARPVDQLTFEEATELAFFGATVLHPLAMQPAAECGVNVRVKNSYNR